MATSGRSQANEGALAQVEVQGDALDPEVVRQPATGHEGHLHLDDATRRQASLRLKTVKGHIEGVLRMLEDDGVYCVDVLKQVKAVTGALGKVSESVLRAHIQDHVMTAAQRGDSDVIVDELMEAIKYRS